GRPRLLGARLCLVDDLARLDLGVGPEPLRRVVGLGQDLARLLPDALEVTPQELGAGLVAAAGLEPVGELVEEPVDLALLVASTPDRERGAANAVDAVWVHALLLALAACLRSGGRLYPHQASGSAGVGRSPE